MLVARNPAYLPAYVMDICRTDDGLRLLETNCINAAGFYAADVNFFDGIGQFAVRFCDGCRKGVQVADYNGYRRNSLGIQVRLVGWD